ncbi:MAG: hypothetical protein Q9220_000894 [cf. Caloplaca sp. 1 TL-2023]
MFFSAMHVVATLGFANAAPGLLRSNTSNSSYSLPQSDLDTVVREAEITADRAGYLYGPSLLGNASFFPTGILGKARTAGDIAIFTKNATFITESILEESQPVVQAVTAAGGFKDLPSYELLYRDQWKRSNPNGVAPGYFTNYTQDLFFSMERLSIGPFTTRRLHPTDDALPFQVDEVIVKQLTGKSLEELHQSGRLFFADHSYQAKYITQPGRFAAACSAYFYICPSSNDLLPLAIKTNVGSNLTYTPLDTAEDWLLAKMMFNNNDYFFGQIFHLANSHAVAEIVYLAALRTLSARHPVRAFLDRVMYQAYAVRPVGSQVLFNPGGFFDQGSAVDHNAVFNFVGQFYPSLAGLFRSNYFIKSLTDRGLLGCSYGPPLKHFPFAEDAGAIVASLRKFLTTYVYTYYPTQNLLDGDKEVQNWIIEANTAAEVLDFPSAPLDHRSTLIDILTQMAYLSGVNHHTLNSNAPSMLSGTLPFHPSGFYKPIPTSKGVQDLVSYLPNLNQSLNQVTLTLRFNRPTLPEEHGELVDMFSSPTFLNGQGMPVQQAVGGFRAEMEAIGQRVESRKFDEKGLSQGMPFIWKVLDPRRIPFFLCV